MKQRSSFAIITLILELCSKSDSTGITKTRIMQNLGLNYKRTNRYCFFMLHSALLSYNLENRTFHITEKGRWVLRNCEELAELISPINNMIKNYQFSEGDLYLTF
jgi:predicted transcriptional regulator